MPTSASAASGKSSTLLVGIAPPFQVSVGRDASDAAMPPSTAISRALGRIMVSAESLIAAAISCDTVMTEGLVTDAVSPTPGTAAGDQAAGSWKSPVPAVKTFVSPAAQTANGTTSARTCNMTAYEKILIFIVIPSSEAFTTQVITPSRLVYSAEIWGKSQAHGALFCGRICRFAAKG